MATFRTKIRLHKESYIQTDFDENNEDIINKMHKRLYTNTPCSKNIANICNIETRSFPKQLSTTSHNKQFSSYSVINNYNNNIIELPATSSHRCLFNKCRTSLTYRNNVSYNNTYSTKKLQYRSTQHINNKSNILNICDKPYIVDRKHSKDVLPPYKFKNIVKDVLKQSFLRRGNKQMSHSVKTKSNCLPELQVDRKWYEGLNVKWVYKRKEMDGDIELTLKDELMKAKEKVERKRRNCSRNKGKGGGIDKTKEGKTFVKREFIMLENPFIHLNRELKKRELIKDNNVVSQVFVSNFKKFK